MGESTAFGDVIAYWQSLHKAGGARVPERAAFDPKSLDQRFARLSLMRRTGRYDITGGLVSRDVSAMWRRPVGGINTFDLAAPDMRENIARFYEAVLDQPCAALVSEKCRDSSGVPQTIQSLYLPMADRDGASRYVVGVTLSEKPGFRASLREQLVLSHCQITALKFIDLGYGLPDIAFTPPPPGRAANMSVRRNWWDRFLPQSGRRSRSDADKTLT